MVHDEQVVLPVGCVSPGGRFVKVKHKLIYDLAISNLRSPISNEFEVEILHGLFGADEEPSVVLDLHERDALFS